MASARVAARGRRGDEGHRQRPSSGGVRHSLGDVEPPSEAGSSDESGSRSPYDPPPPSPWPPSGAARDRCDPLSLGQVGSVGRLAQLDVLEVLFAATAAIGVNRELENHFLRSRQRGDIGRHLVALPIGEIESAGTITRLRQRNRLRCEGLPSPSSSRTARTRRNRTSFRCSPSNRISDVLVGEPCGTSGDNVFAVANQSAELQDVDSARLPRSPRPDRVE